jgi:hypothetical protein
MSAFAKIGGLLMLVLVVLGVVAALFLVAAVFLQLGVNAASPAFGLERITHTQATGVLVAAAALGWAVRAGAPAIGQVQLQKHDGRKDA